MTGETHSLVRADVRLRDAVWSLAPGARLGLGAVLGAVAALGQAPVSFPFATLAAFALVFWLAPAAPTRRAATRFGWAVGTGHFLVALHWIVEPFLVDVARHGWMAPFALAFMAGGLALFWAAAFATARRGALTLALALTLAEYLRSVILTGFPWALPGHVWIGWSPAQLARLVGPHGLTLMTLLLAALPGMMSGRAAPRMAAFVAATGALWGGTVLWDRATPAPAPDRQILRIVQPNAPQDEKWLPGNAERFFERSLALTEKGPRADLVVWPETSVPWFLSRSEVPLSMIAAAADGASTVVGIQRREGTRYYNALAVVGQDGTASDVYDKAHLVPFGEYIPAGDLIDRLFGSVLNRFGIHGLAANAGGGYSAGPGGRLIDLPGIGPALPLICYEGIFAEEVGAVSPRPRLMVLITNDAWFGDYTGPYQHLALARLRAIEQGLPMVRAANTGVSAIIDARGRIVTEIPLGLAGVRDARLPAALPPTLYARTGDWPTLALVLLLLLATTLRRRAFSIDRA